MGKNKMAHCYQSSSSHDVVPDANFIPNADWYLPQGFTQELFRAGIGLKPMPWR